MRKQTMILLTFSVMTLFYFLFLNINLKYLLAGILYREEISMDDGIIFSQKTGFYNDEFVLKMYAPSNEIYYTLDGSEPSKESYRYEGAIQIYDASENQNTNSMRTDVSSWFYYAEDYHCTVPNYLIDKCTIVKAVYYDKFGNKSPSEMRVYFVGFEEKSGYDNVNIISITADPDDLFGEERGIYVLGDTFSTYAEETDYEDVEDYIWPANYRNKGKEWERAANIEVFDINKNHVLSQVVGLRIQGGASRAFVPKSLNLYARKEYGNNRMQCDFWGTGYYPKKLTLATGGNDFYGKSKDRIGAEMSKECAFATMNYEPYVLFLNGEYWGFYYLAEKYDEHYIEHYYHVNEDNIIMIKTGSLEVGESDDVLLYEAMKTFVESTDMSLDENYKKACTMIDIESFIDYYAAEIFMARCGDWPIGNYALWRSRKTSLQPYEDGKWRYMLFDVNSSAFSSDLVEHDTLDWVLSLDPIFRSLSENQDFRENFSIRLCEMRDIVFEKRKVTDRLEEYRILMNDPMDKHLQRFFSKNQGTFNRRIDNMEGFINQRKDYIEVMLENNGF